MLRPAGYAALILGGGEIRGLMVEAPKSDDPVEQRESVAWTRGIIEGLL